MIGNYSGGQLKEVGDRKVERSGGVGWRAVVGAQLQEVASEAVPLDPSTMVSGLANMCLIQTLPFKRP